MNAISYLVFICDHCSSVYKTKTEAEECCLPPTSIGIRWKCGVCNKEWCSLKYAENCCAKTNEQ